MPPAAVARQAPPMLPRLSAAGRPGLSCLLALVVGVHVASPAAIAQSSAKALPCAGLEPGPRRTVTRIVDAETVALDDSSELRLIGALAPRAIDVGADPGMWPLEVAARAELAALLLGRSLDIAFGAGERADRYGRLQAQAFWRDGDKLRWAQGHMLEQGLARAYALAASGTCRDELLAAERTAREAGRGVWKEAAYQVRGADRPLELARYSATFQIVEGRIARVTEVRGTNLSQLRRRLAQGLQRIPAARGSIFAWRFRRPAEGACGTQRARARLGRAEARPLDRPLQRGPHRARRRRRRCRHLRAAAHTPVARQSRSARTGPGAAGPGRANETARPRGDRAVRLDKLLRPRLRRP